VYVWIYEQKNRQLRRKDLRIIVEKRNPLPWKKRIFLPVAAIMASMLVSSVLILWAGENVFNVWFLMAKSAVGTKYAFYATLTKMAPLLFTGLGIVFAYKVGFWNIGGEGQLYVGAAMAALIGTLPLNLSPWIHIPLILIAGFVAGGLFALIPAWFKWKLNMDDVVTTLMLNFIIIHILETILYGPWLDPVTRWPRSPEIAESAWFPSIIPRTQFHVGIVLSIIVAILVFIVIKKTRVGFEIKMTGLNEKAARFCGMNTKKIFLTAALVSGGLAGLAGVNEVCAIHGYLISDISPGYGYYGIVVALLAGLHPLGVILSSFFFAALLTGASTVSRLTTVPFFIADFIQGIVLIFMMTAMLFANYRVRLLPHLRGRKKNINSR
jgi:general nucleoside transport system permease protein